MPLVQTKRLILDLEYIRETFEYSEVAQGLIWRRNQRPLGRKGERAGGIDTRTGQRVIHLGNSSTPESRVIWAMTYNCQPPSRLRNKNGIRTDNRIENLEPIERIGKRRVTHEELLDLINYNPLTGELRWKVARGSRVKPGDAAGCLSHGYRAVRIHNIIYQAHVLAWFYMMGLWPESDIDHIDRNRANNRWENLRLADQSQNRWNATDRNNKTGYRGVQKQGKKFSSKINKHGKEYYLGTFDTAEEAHIAYRKKCIELHGEFSIYYEEENEKIKATV